jgi:hypothetical protein
VGELLNYYGSRSDPATQQSGAGRVVGVDSKGLHGQQRPRRMSGTNPWTFLDARLLWASHRRHMRIMMTLSQQQSGSDVGNVALHGDHRLARGWGASKNSGGGSYRLLYFVNRLPPCKLAFYAFGAAVHGPQASDLA